MNKRTLLSLAPVALLSACGFRLRGVPEFAFKSVYIAAPTGSPLARELQRTLRERAGFVPLPPPEEAEGFAYDEAELRRIERLREEYFTRMHHDFFTAYGEEQGWQEYSAYLHHGLFAIRRRLGLQRFAELTATLDESLAEQRRSGSTEAHFAWLVPLLNEYYDPMYRYQLEKKADKIVFRGTSEDVVSWLSSHP